MTKKDIVRIERKYITARDNRIKQLEDNQIELLQRQFEFVINLAVWTEANIRGNKKKQLVKLLRSRLIEEGRSLRDELFLFSLEKRGLWTKYKDYLFGRAK